MPNMTKEYVRERAALQRQIKSAQRELATVLKNLTRARGTVQRAYAKTSRELSVARGREVKSYDREEKLARSAHERRTKDALTRIAILEGRLA